LKVQQVGSRLVAPVVEERPMSPHPAVARARRFAVCGLVLAAAALVTVWFSSAAAIALGAAAILCAAVAWLRSDPSVGGGRTLAAWSLVVAVLAGIVGIAGNAVDPGVAAGQPSPAVVTAVGADETATPEVVIDGLAVEVRPARTGSGGSGAVVPVTVTNVGSAAGSFAVHLEAVDATGSDVATDTVAVDALAVGHSTTLGAFEDTDRATGAKVHDATVRVAGVDRI
jgi:hypothetical protein